jgi:hypothetical protein
VPKSTFVIIFGKGMGFLMFKSLFQDLTDSGISQVDSKGVPGLPVK